MASPGTLSSKLDVACGLTNPPPLPRERSNLATLLKNKKKSWMPPSLCQNPKGMTNKALMNEALSMNLR